MFQDWHRAPPTCDAEEEKYTRIDTDTQCNDRRHTPTGLCRSGSIWGGGREVQARRGGRSGGEGGVGRERAPGLHMTTRELPTCTFERPGRFKHHQNSMRRPSQREERTKFAAGEGKKREIFGPPFGAPNFGALTFSGFWAAHPRGPHPLGPTCSLTGLEPHRL